MKLRVCGLPSLGHMLSRGVGWEIRKLGRRYSEVKFEGLYSIVLLKKVC